jgi:hypothetical protein
MSAHDGEEAECVRRFEKISILPAVGARTVRPIDAVEKRRQRAKKASGFGHAGAICE